MNSQYTSYVYFELAQHARRTGTCEIWKGVAPPFVLPFLHSDLGSQFFFLCPALQALCMVLHVCFSLCPAFFFAGSLYGSVGLLMKYKSFSKKKKISNSIESIDQLSWSPTKAKIVTSFLCLSFPSTLPHFCSVKSAINVEEVEIEM